MDKLVFWIHLFSLMLRSSTLRTGFGSMISSALLFRRTAHADSNSKSCSINMSGTTIEITNPLLKKTKKQLPLFRDITPKDITPAMEYILTDLESNFKNLETKINVVDASYDVVIEELERLQFPMGFAWGVVSHLMAVKNSDELRKEYEALQPKIIQMSQKLGQSKAIYDALIQIRENPILWDNLDEPQKRIMNSSIHSMKTGGVGLEGAEKEKFNTLQVQLAELSTKFSNNILDSTKQFKLVLTDKSLIKGLPDSAVAFATHQAISNGHPNATKENGPWLLTLDMPSYLPAMQGLENREIREQLYRAFNTRASSGDYNNIEIISKILSIKQEIAHLLGYKTHAEKSLSKKMAGSVEDVSRLIEMLRVKSYPAAVSEIKELQQFATSQGLVGDLQLWDVPYWSERYREHQYNYTEEELRPYFALPNVLDGLFSLAQRLFDIKIEEPTESEKQDIHLWNNDVRFFNIKDGKTGEYLASFFLDPYSRPAEKRGGAWMDGCLGRSRALNTKPVAYLVCNGSPPIGDEPSLMTYREVVTLFHEFGHGLQHMLTKVEYGDAAGISNVEWDAVELPSQFMENWCFDKNTLYTFAKHYKTNEPLPEELFEKVTKAKNYQAGLAMIRQLLFGSIDMQLHSTYDPSGKELTPFDIYQQIAPKYTVIPPLEDDKFLCGFSHIFAGGYSAGYYSYKWAEVMSADAFGAFEEVGLDNETEVKRVGEKFRDTVLSMGGGRHPSDVFRDFRGRNPSPEALLRHSGLLLDSHSDRKVQASV